MLDITAALAAAALSQSAAPTGYDVQLLNGGQVVRLTFQDMASVTTAPPPAKVSGSLRSEPIRMDASTHAFETGVRNIALSTGFGSNSQAVTSVSFTVAISGIGQ